MTREVRIKWFRLAAASKCNENVASKNKVLWSAIKFEEKICSQPLRPIFFCCCYWLTANCEKKSWEKLLRGAPRMDKLNGDGVKMVNFIRQRLATLLRTIGGWSLCRQLRDVRLKSDCSATKYDLNLKSSSTFWRQEKEEFEKFSVFFRGWLKALSNVFLDD